MKHYLLAVGAIIAVGSTAVSAAPPANDRCEGAIEVACGSSVTGTLWQASTDNLSDPALTYVFFLLTVPAGYPQDVTITVAGDGLTIMRHPRVEVLRVDEADPCAGMRSGAMMRQALVTPSRDIGRLRRPILSGFESVSFEFECLAPGQYLIAIGTAPVLEEGRSGFELSVQCEECIPLELEPGEIESADPSRQMKDLFHEGQGVYATGALTAGMFNQIDVITRQTLINGQPIPAPIAGSAVWVSMDATGSPQTSDLELPEVDTISYSSEPPPALVWLADQTGEFTIIIDRDRDGIYTDSIDILDANGFTVIPCDCQCHADPQCDALINVLDVVDVVNVAFRGSDPDTDAGCPIERTDVDCSGFTNVLDAVKVVNVAFRSADPNTQFCMPCPMPAAVTFIRGDIDCNSTVDNLDVSYLNAFFNSGGPSPACEDAADVNDDGAVNLADIITLTAFLANGVSPPLAPFPECGVDPSPDGLNCGQSCCSP